MTTKAKSTSKTVAVLSRQPNLAAALTAILSPRIPSAEFVTITKLGDIPEGDVTLASVGLPAYLPTDRVSEVISVSTSYVEDDGERKRQWEALRSEDTPIEDLIEILGNPDSYKVIPSKRAIAVRADFAEARADFAEAAPAAEATDAEKVEALTAQLAAMTRMRDLAVSVSALK